MLIWPCAFVNFERHSSHNPLWLLSHTSCIAIFLLCWVTFESFFFFTLLTYKMRKKNPTYLSVLLWEVCSHGVDFYLVGLLKTVSNLTNTNNMKARNISSSSSGIDITKTQGFNSRSTFPSCEGFKLSWIPGLLVENEVSLKHTIACQCFTGK